MSDGDRLWLASLVCAKFADQIEAELASRRPDDEYLPQDAEFMRGYYHGLDSARFLWRCGTEGEGAAMLEEVKKLNAIARSSSQGGQGDAGDSEKE